MFNLIARIVDVDFWNGGADYSSATVRGEPTNLKIWRSS